MKNILPCGCEYAWPGLDELISPCPGHQKTPVIDSRKIKWPDLCPVCSEPYPSASMKLLYCKHPFHSCRQCVWFDGEDVIPCQSCWKS